MPAASRTPSHRLYSSPMNVPNSAAPEPCTTTPTATSRARTFSSVMISRSVLLSLSTTGGDMPGGPNTPYQVVTSLLMLQHYGNGRCRGVIDVSLHYSPRAKATAKEEPS